MKMDKNCNDHRHTERKVLTKAVTNVAAIKEARNPEGAEILGIHFEGTYLNVKRKGAQSEQFIVTPSVEQFMNYQEAQS